MIDIRDGMKECASLDANDVNDIIYMISLFALENNAHCLKRLQLVSTSFHI